MKQLNGKQLLRNCYRINGISARLNHMTGYAFSPTSSQREAPKLAKPPRGMRRDAPVLPPGVATTCFSRTSVWSVLPRALEKWRVIVIVALSTDSAQSSCTLKSTPALLPPPSNVSDPLFHAITPVTG